MLRLSLWQWDRHLWKQEVISDLEARMLAPVSDLGPSSSPYERVKISGTYDFEHEVVLRNRRYENIPGVYLLTPFKINGSNQHILIQRGFVPLTVSDPESRKQFQRSPHDSFIALLKPTEAPKLRGFSSLLTWIDPTDPPAGPGHPWVDAWLRVDLLEIQKQLPYDLIPVFAELIDRDSGALTEDKIVRSDAGREEIFMMPIGGSPIRSKLDVDLSQFPKAQFKAVVPAGRHLGYVYEWAFLALLTLAIGVILQFRRYPKSGLV